MIHDFRIRDVRDGSPILRCANGNCRVVWWPDRRRPASACNGTPTQDTVHALMAALPEVDQYHANRHQEER